MSITSKIIDRIVPFASNWARSTGKQSVLSLIEEGQDELFSADSQSLLWLSTDNKGWPPYLSTTAETYQYELKAANLVNVASITKTINGTAYTVRPKEVKRVFVDTNTDFDFTRHFMGEPYIHSYNNPFRSSNDRVEIAEIPVRSEPALEGNYPLITFPSDPGTSTDMYFVEFTWEPMRLISESIPVCIPQRFYAALIDFALGRISQLENGQENDRLKRFYSGYDQGTGFVPSWLDQFSAYMNSGAQANSHQVLPLW